MTQHFNRKNENLKRKHLRHNTSKAENELWLRLKGKQLLGIKFRRQYSVDSYILDFYAPKIKLAIEVDGDSHFTRSGIEYDEKRTKYIEGFGIKILRFPNNEVLRNIDVVLSEIYRAIEEAM
jgi:very-short-patch-repair endonuclease